MVLYIIVAAVVFALFGLGLYIYIKKYDKTYKAIQEKKQKEREELQRLVDERNEAKRLKEKAEREYEEARRKQIEDYKKAEIEFRRPITRELLNEETGKKYKEVRYREFNDLPEIGEADIFYLVDNMTLTDRNVDHIDVYIWKTDSFSRLTRYYHVLTIDNLEGYQAFIDANLNK